MGPEAPGYRDAYSGPVMTRPVVLVLIGIASVQVGAAVAKSLFGEVTPTAMMWLRLLTSAVVLVALARPVLRGRSRADWLTVLGFGTSLGLMNWAIYESFSRIPIGVAVTIEFIGPLSLALFLSRRPKDLVWVALAAGGVVLLGFDRTDLDPWGIVLALLAGSAWASYILLSAQTGLRWPGLDGLAVASVVAAVLFATPAWISGGTTLLEPRILVLGALVGLLSSVIPYSVELVALRSIRPGVFGILMSMEPAAAALAAMLVLGELLSVTQWVAVACVIVASVGSTRSGTIKA